MSRQTGKPISVSELLEQGQGLLQQLRDGAAASNRAQAALQRHLPAELADQIRGATVKDGTLTLLVSSASWGTRLRYHMPRISAAIGRELGLEIERVSVRVRPGA